MPRESVRVPAHRLLITTRTADRDSAQLIGMTHSGGPTSNADGRDSVNICVSASPSCGKNQTFSSSSACLQHVLTLLCPIHTLGNDPLKSPMSRWLKRHKCGVVYREYGNLKKRKANRRTMAARIQDVLADFLDSSRTGETPSTLRHSLCAPMLRYSAQAPQSTQAAGCLLSVIVC
ncbi:unnamed protein product [Pleuronectes platessa]|uniref:Uncharacterized protein n=1 Tax=Pleuronectes platessa TaxID=8262 RepID=A0A9N7VCQ0_PLEPL|nr:unnamed protein product [Pleuronectes platessa]